MEHMIYDATQWQSMIFIVVAWDGDAEGGSVVMTDGKVIVLADDEGVNTIVEAGGR